MTDDLDLDELAADLADFAPQDKKGGRSAREERIIAGFEEIQRFVEVQGRAPAHGETNDIFERLYAVRLDRLRGLEECRSLLAPLDKHGLLAGVATPAAEPAESIDDEELLAELEGMGAPDITELRHVRTAADKRAAEEIANREKCEDFDKFRPLFEQVQRELANGIRETRPFQDDARIEKDHWFILGGQKTYIAEEGDEFVADYGRKDRRLRVIFDNGTESTMLKRSVERALQKDGAGRRITEPVAGPLFANESAMEDDWAAGTIYVLRSKSDNPVVAAHRDVLHKIGVTGGGVSQRISNAKLDPTYLMADVEVVATYELYNINRTKLERLIHRIFSSAQLDIVIKDRFGNPVVPREWFLVPLFVIDEAVDRIKDGTISNFRYDPKSASLTEA